MLLFLDPDRKMLNHMLTKVCLAKSHMQLQNCDSNVRMQAISVALPEDLPCIYSRRHCL